MGLIAKRLCRTRPCGGAASILCISPELGTPICASHGVNIAEISALSGAFEASGSHAARVRMDGANQHVDTLGRRVLIDAVAQVEDVCRPASARVGVWRAETVEHIRHFGLDLRWTGE